jgi:uncharacterized phage protein (TIGR01671 family)
MREIKFRVYDKRLKSMHIVGTDSHDSLTCFDGIVEYYNLQNGEGSGESGDYILMQYTGLKDKNGKEIYEGDICETVTYSGKPFGTIDVVKFSGGAFKLTDIEDALLPIPLDDSDIQSVEVIGNIFQDGDLLRDS